MAEGEAQELMSNQLYEKARQGVTPWSSSDNPVDNELASHLTLVGKNNVLHVAAQHGNHGFIVNFLNQFPNNYELLSKKNSKGETPLHLAAQHGDEKTVNFLIEAHEMGTADWGNWEPCWSVGDVNGDTPLHRALRFRNEDVALLLLSKDTSLVNRQTVIGESPAYLAAENFCETFLHTIFAEPNVDLTTDLILNHHLYGDANISFSGPFDQTAFHPTRKLTDDIMSLLVERRGSLLSKADDKGKTVLQYAVEEKRESIVKILLTANSELAYVHDNDGMTPLHIAAKMGFSSMIRIILKLSPQSILLRTFKGETALHVAKMDAFFLSGCLKSTRMKELINVCDYEGNTPLHFALKNSCGLDVASALLQVGDINWRLKNKGGSTPMDLCKPGDPIRSNLRQLECAWEVKGKVNMEIFYRENVKINVKDLMRHYSSWDELSTYQGYQGNSILHIAARDGCLNFINKVCQAYPAARLLLLSGQNSKGETPLHLAAQYGYIDVVRAILIYSSLTNILGEKTVRKVTVENGQRVIPVHFTPWRTKSANGDTPLHRAVRHRHDNVSKYLLLRDPELACLANEEGESVLYLAVQNSCKYIIYDVLDLPQYSVSGPDGQTPLHAAVRNSEISVKRFTRLIKELKKLNAVDKDGKTPLHYAVEQNRNPIVIELLKEDISAAFVYDSEGFTPLLRAVACGFRPCVESILEYCPHSSELRDAHYGRTVVHLAKFPDYAMWNCLQKHGLLKLFNEPDREGNTPLHCAILEGDITKAINIMKFIGVNRRIRNKQQQTPSDLCKVLMANGDGEQQMIRMCYEHLQGSEAKAAESKLSRLMSSCKHPMHQINFPNVRVVFGDTSAYLEGLTQKELKQLLNNIAVAAALLVTITFAAIFTVPGGYRSDNSGELVRMPQVAVRLFVAADIVAMLVSIAILIKFTYGVTRRILSLRTLANKCIHMLLISVMATTAAFTFAVYAIVFSKAIELFFIAIAVVAAIIFWGIL